MAQKTDPSVELFLKECAHRTNQEIDSCLKNYSDKTLAEVISYASLSGGKRIRPGLVYATALALDIKFETADPIACAIELIHCYSLVHDDLPAMDDDDFRRGQPSCHKTFGEAEAILAGNAMQALAFEHLATTPRLTNQEKLTAIKLLSCAAGLEGMASGQAMDIKNKKSIIDVNYLEQIHRLKTGSLMATCITILLECAVNASPIMRKSLSAYASDIGLCFQIRDDILDAKDSDELVAGVPNSNKSAGELNYPIIAGLAYAKEKLKELEKHCLSHLVGVKGKTLMLQKITHYIATRSN